MPTNIRENGFETLICDYLVNNNGFELGNTAEYNKDYAIDEGRLFRFLESSQPDKLAELHLQDSPLEKKRFLEQLDKKLKGDGVIEVLRRGLKYKHLHFDMMFVRPSPQNPQAKEDYEKNIFSVTRQLQYSVFNPKLALDVCIFINGLPVITMELKNQLTKQNVADAVEQYKNDRSPSEPLFSFKQQIEFKSSAKAFVRTYNFLAAIMPYGSVEWEKLAIFLNLLIPKLPSPEGEDYTKGLLDDVELESYRAQAKEAIRIQLDNENGEINPIPVSTSVGINVPELDTLTNILKEFHDAFGNIEWTDEDKIKKQIQELFESVDHDEQYINARRFSDIQNARTESDRAAGEALIATMKSGIELYREVQNNPSFKKWLFDSVFNATYIADSGNRV